MVKAVIFDFFGVLVTEGFKQFRDEYFAENVEKRRQAIELVTAHDWGKLSRREYITGLARLAGVSEEEVSLHMADNQPNELLVGFIKNTLKPEYKVSVLSNSGDDYISQIMAPEDVKLFDDIVLSYKQGMVKPHAEIFEFAAKRLGVEPNECIYIDDSYRHCEGARAVGMHAIRYRDFQQMKQELENILSSRPNN